MSRSYGRSEPFARRTIFLSVSTVVAVSRTSLTPWRAPRFVYGVVRYARSRLPPSTRFDIGHEMNSGLGSTSVTSIVLLLHIRTYLAAVAPP
jgi:hypothetical protein